MDLFAVDWHGLFTPGAPIAETVLRASFMYFVLLGLLRLIPNRHLGTIGIADVLVVVLLANTAQNAITNGYKSITDGLILLVTIIVWSHVFNWMGYRFPWFQRVMRPPPTPLVKNGEVILPNLRRELITEEELLSKIRQEGIGDLGHVKVAFMEGDGRISVVTHDNGRPRPGLPQKPIV